jgi:hypothetical protein
MLRFLCVNSNPSFLLVSIKVSVFFFMVSVLSPSGFGMTVPLYKVFNISYTCCLSYPDTHRFMYHIKHCLVLEIESVVDKTLLLLPGTGVLWWGSNAYWPNSSASPDLKWLGIFWNPSGTFRRGNWRKQTNSGLWSQECVNSNISGALFCGVYESYNANRYFWTTF